jgi:hypothetical protein
LTCFHIVEAAIDDRHYLVRFDDLIGFTDGTRWPESLAVVAIDDMSRAGRDGDDNIPPPWEFFDDIEKRRAYDAWMNEPTPDRKPVSCRCDRSRRTDHHGISHFSRRRLRKSPSPPYRSGPLPVHCREGPGRTNNRIAYRPALQASVVCVDLERLAVPTWRIFSSAIPSSIRSRPERLQIF